MYLFSSRSEADAVGWTAHCSGRTDRLLRVLGCQDDLLTEAERGKGWMHGVGEGHGRLQQCVFGQAICITMGRGVGLDVVNSLAPIKNSQKKQKPCTKV